MTPGGRHGEGRRSRRELRLAVDLPATLGGRESRVGRAVDLSLSGCLVRSEASLDAGAVIDLHLELPDGVLRTKARVAEASIDGDSASASRPRYLLGLEFFGLPAADEIRLRRFVAVESGRRRSANTPPS